MNYAQVMRTARSNIDLSALGVESLRLKESRTGARLLELPGASSAEKADVLAAKLRETFAEEEVRVTRPTKRADVRLSGLDDSVVEDEVVGAVARAGNCRPEDLKVGPIRRRGTDGTGPGTAIVSCPVAVAQKLVDGRRVIVGWVSVQTKLMPPRPSRCYKCLGVGHLGVHCTSEIDCSGKCFRCGEPGHMAGICNAPPHCIVCAAAGKSADHRAGGNSCHPPTQKRRQTGRKPAVAATTREGTEMES